ncbi:magnesium/cobalt transporter CorA [bacterium]|nr:magnesium/cobalt transporter CorA [bacterium]
MSRFIQKREKSHGLPPGTLKHIGDKKSERAGLTLIDYDENNIVEKEIETIDKCALCKDKDTVTWLNIDGLHQEDVIERAGVIFDFHSLLLEDVLNTDQRPKMEEYDNYIFIIIKMLYYDENTGLIRIEQVSIVFGPNYVVTFQEIKGDVFNAVRERIRNGKGRIRKLGSDYLAYALVDAVVDHYFIILEKIGDKIEELEQALVDNPTQETSRSIHSLKREMIFLRKSIWPLREVISGLERTESPIIKKDTLLFLRDVYDHTIQIIDTVETYRDMVSGMLDTYLSSISNRMNEVMKVLTIIATIFIPLTFIAGVYGMNFRYMPELQWKLSYPIVLLVMIFIGITMIIYFKRKKWL